MKVKVNVNNQADGLVKIQRGCPEIEYMRWEVEKFFKKYC